MNDHAFTRDNPGGGVRLYDHGSLTMNDSSTITDNRAMVGGGVLLREDSTLTMNDSATITDNAARASPFRAGGGVWVSRDGGTLVGVICAPKRDANVFGNSPDDCHMEP